MKIFVTGATGFIGTHLVKRLIETDHELCCLVRETSNVTQLDSSRVSLVFGDVTDKNSIVAGMRGSDWVANLANVYSFWEPDKQVYARVNVNGTRNVMEAALETGVSKIAHVSSVVTYGRPAACPFKEDTPEGPVRFSEYARTKYEGDLITWKMYEERNLPVLMLYPGAVVGPGDTKASGQYVKNLIDRRLPGTVYNDSVLSWVYVKDVAEAILRALEKQDNIGEKYFVCNERLAIGEFNRLISEISGVPLPRMQIPDFLAMLNARLLTALANVVKRPPILGMAVDQMRTMKEGFEADGGKAERELGLRYTPIRSALEEAIASYR